MRLNLRPGPEGHIARLDASLARSGTPALLRRYVSGTDTWVDLPLRAFMRGLTPDQLVGGVKATDSKFVLSPSGLASPSWPGAAGGDPVPTAGDFLVVNGAERKIEAVQPVMMAGEAVRFDGIILGLA